MSTVTLERVVADAKALTADEQRELRMTLDEWLVERHEEEMKAKEQFFAQKLLDKGIISHLPRRDAASNYQRHPPIVVQGEPVSETIIRERR